MDQESKVVLRTLQWLWLATVLRHFGTWLAGVALLCGVGWFCYARWGFQGAELWCGVLGLGIAFGFLERLFVGSARLEPLSVAGASPLLLVLAPFYLLYAALKGTFRVPVLLFQASAFTAVEKIQDAHLNFRFTLTTGRVLHLDRTKGPDQEKGAYCLFGAPGRQPRPLYVYGSLFDVLCDLGRV